MTALIALLSRSQGPVIGAVSTAAALVTAPAAAISCPAALRNRPMPSSRLVMNRSSLWGRSNLWRRSSRRHQTITNAAHRLHDQRIAGIAFDLAPKPVDLHIYSALADRPAIAGERLARHRLARACRQYPQHIALAVGEPDDLVAAAQLATRYMEHELAEAHRFRRRRTRWPCPPENVRDPQRQLARLERLRKIIVRADFESHDPAFLLVACGQHQDRHVGRSTERSGEIEAAFAGHHHVENE